MPKLKELPVVKLVFLSTCPKCVSVPARHRHYYSSHGMAAAKSACFTLSLSSLYGDEDTAQMFPYYLPSSACTQLKASSGDWQSRKVTFLPHFYRWTIIIFMRRNLRKIQFYSLNVRFKCLHVQIIHK